MTGDPLRECLQGAWAALLRGDYAERDRILARGRRIAHEMQKAPPIKLIRQPDGSYVPEIKRQS